MASVKWTDEQQAAIDKKGSNILVAAAAGSGKTAVLVERIIKKIIVDRVDIDKILVVTFTNAAAAEMRERILEAIYKKIEENPEDANLQKQIILLNKSSICTIDSFCLDVIRNNFYEIDISANARVADSTEMLLLKQEVLDDMFEAKYISGDKDFLDLIDTYTKYNKDEDLKECFLETQKYFNEVLQKKLVMYVVDKAAVDLLQLPEDEYVVVSDRTYADYVYDAEKLRTFSGKKYHKKKNHLNAFKREYEGRYEFKFLSKKDEPEILAFLEDWKKHKSDTEEHEFIDSEAVGIKYILEHEEVFDYKIGAVYVDNKLEAFTIGNYESKEDMVYIPVEKANPEIRGLYPYICSQFLIEAFPEAGKENREDDMGLEGLRKSKLSYNPIYMVEKYTIIQK